MYLFGVSFALASLGCTIGPFLAVVVTSFGSPDGIGLFLAYAAGMALVVGIVAVATALAQKAVLRTLRRSAAWMHRVAGALMVLAGAYVAIYGWSGTREGPDPVVSAAGQVQTWLAAAVERAGAGVLALVLLALMIALLVAGSFRSKAG
jgi:cytochrome c-type biogenesis protein